MTPQNFSLLFITALMIGLANLNASAAGIRDAVGNTSELSTADTKTANPLTIEGNEWKLIEVYIDGRNTRFSRDTLPEELKNFFTVNFDAQNVSGVGAPNRYSAPYAKGDSQTINIMLMRSTMMASFFQPENLSEHDFFTYMQNAYSWKLVNETLELHSKTENGSEIRMVFSL